MIARTARVPARVLGGPAQIVVGIVATTRWVGTTLWDCFRSVYVSQPGYLDPDFMGTFLPLIMCVWASPIAS